MFVWWVQYLFYLPKTLNIYLFPPWFLFEIRLFVLFTLFCVRGFLPMSHEPWLSKKSSGSCDRCEWLIGEVFAVGLFGWVVSSLNPSIRIFRSFLVGWSWSPEKDSLIYCPEKEGLASGILETGSGRRLGLIFRAGPRPCTVPGMSFQPSFRREEQLGRDRTWVSNCSTRGV